ncbi:F-box protein At4g09920-like [Papaver somniferum]|uniref:F-box protein At4g09920-like n=1 Tax=Papaver somniferum TaxID=3469 RepID=UPI000E700664|nr:F-box protein At4g09920-like [Papaver somniferum]
MEEEGVGGEDRIRSLPESLIRHILSLLPTKCVVATTILSRGWNNLWISLPVLDFREWKSPNTQETLSSTNSFMDFVDRVLLLRNMSDIKKFCLTCNSEYFDDQRIKAWILTAIQCRVEELIVSRDASERVDIIPVDLYTCESLTSLDIDLFGGQHLNLPQLISFPRLKILQLSEISVFRQRNIQQLFSNCPILEELCLKYCLLNHLNIISSTLKSLTFVSSLRICMSDVKIKIDTPNLISITVDDGIPQHLVVESFPSLVDADIHRMYTDPSVPVDVIPNFVKKLSNVKHLKLSGNISESLELADVLSTSFPTFINLITLEVSFYQDSAS